MYKQTLLNKVHHTIIATLLAITASTASAYESVIVKTTVDGETSKVELTKLNKRVTIFNESHNNTDEDCSGTFRAYATLKQNGVVDLEYNNKTIEPLGLFFTDYELNYSNFTTLKLGKTDDHKFTYCAVTGELPIRVKTAEGQYNIECKSSLPKGYLIQEQSGANYYVKNYFSSTATLTASTSNSCTYSGEITVEYSTPLQPKPGKSKSNSSTTFPLDKVTTSKKKE